MGKGVAEVVDRNPHVAPVEIAPQPTQPASQNQGGPPGQQAEKSSHHGGGPGLDRQTPGPSHAALRPIAASSRSHKRSSGSARASVRRTSTGSAEAAEGKRTASLAVMTSASAPSGSA